MFVAGPPVVAGLGEDLDQQELGGWKLQLSAGAVDEAVDTEKEAFDHAKKFLSYLPSSVDELAERAPNSDPANRRDLSFKGLSHIDQLNLFNDFFVLFWGYLFRHRLSFYTTYFSTTESEPSIQ